MKMVVLTLLFIAIVFATLHITSNSWLLIALALTLALWARQSSEYGRFVSIPPLENHNSQLLYKKAILGVVAIALVTGANVLLVHNWGGSATIAWLAGLVVLASCGVGSSKHCDRLSHLQRALLVVIVGAALLLRYIFADGVAIHHFEAIWGLDILAILNGNVRSPFTWIGDFPSNMPSFLMLLPWSIIRHDPTVLRNYTIFYGALAVIPLFFVVRLLTSHPFGAFAAICAWTFSMWTVNEASHFCNFSIYQLLHLCGLWAVLRGVASGSSRATIVGGLIFGVLLDMLYVQMSAFLCVIGMYCAGFFSAGAITRRTYTLHLILFVVALAIAASPTATRYLFLDAHLFIRHESAIQFKEASGLGQTADQGLLSATLLKTAQLIQTYFLSSSFEEQRAFFHEPYWPPLLDQAAVVTACIGVMVLALRPLSPITILLFLSFALMFAPVLLRPASYYRLSATAPVLFVFVGIGAASLFRILQSISFSRRWVAWIGGAVGLGLFAHVAIRQNLMLFMESRARKLEMSSQMYGLGGAETLGRMITSAADDCAVIVSGPARELKTIEFFSYLAGDRVPSLLLLDFRDLPQFILTSEKRNLCMYSSFGGEGLHPSRVMKLVEDLFPGGMQRIIEHRFAPNDKTRPFGLSYMVAIDSSDGVPVTSSAYSLFIPETAIYDVLMDIRNSQTRPTLLLHGELPLQNTILTKGYEPLIWGDKNNQAFAIDLVPKSALSRPLPTHAAVLLPFHQSPFQLSAKMRSDALFEHRTVKASSESLSLLCDSTTIQLLWNASSFHMQGVIQPKASGDYHIQIQGDVPVDLVINGTLMVSHSGEEFTTNAPLPWSATANESYLVEVRSHPMDRRPHCLYVKWKAPQTSEFFDFGVQ
ncbi:MAG: hypothetical protein QY326_02330 [Bdellovibrionota bacterium]|nr:MAG: hypothetical protein QY326_02330 [Bdellovibrionota bacterium]